MALLSSEVQKLESSTYISNDLDSIERILRDLSLILRNNYQGLKSNNTSNDYAGSANKSGIVSSALQDLYITVWELFGALDRILVAKSSRFDIQSSGMEMQLQVRNYNHLKHLHL